MSLGSTPLSRVISLVAEHFALTSIKQRPNRTDVSHRSNSAPATAGSRTPRRQAACGIDLMHSAFKAATVCAVAMPVTGPE